jgi:hypothetical protein
MHKFSLKDVLMFVIATAVAAVIYKQQFAPMYRNLSGVMMVRNDYYTDILVNGTRDHYCIPISIDALIEVNGNMVPAGDVEFLGRYGEIIPLEQQRIPIDGDFVRLGRFFPGSDHVQLFLNARCLPFITRRYLIVDVVNKLPK